MNAPSKTWWFRPDGWLWLPALLLAAVGIAFIYSAASVHGLGDITYWYQHPFVRQIAALLLGLGIAVALCAFDYHVIARWSMVCYWLSLLLLLIVFLYEPRFGARRWISVGGLALQPSEFAKIATICSLAHFLSRPSDELRAPHLLLRTLIMIALPMGLILLEPDLGSSIVFIPVGLAMMFLAGIPRSYLIRLLLAASAMVLLVLLDALFYPRLIPVFQLEDYQTNRIRVYLGMPFASVDATPNEKRRADLEERKFTYNVDQALISVGSGGWSGKGWCEGTQNALGYLPKKVAHNDFIFSVLGEEFGLMACIGVLLIYTLLVLRGVALTARHDSLFTALAAAGLVSQLGLQALINMASTLALIPTKGMTLP
ncbi:MAG: FtsW/RodA/SpoVE family cell cycle protein, partial [Limisphaerales bacterium]